jgi:hypothetical protein
MACIFGSALLGIALRAVLPRHHFEHNTEDIVKLGLGLIATLSALVLGLLVSSASTSFQAAGDELTDVAVKTLELDRTLSQYGPETAGARNLLARGYATAVDSIFSGDPAKLAALVSPAGVYRSEGVLYRIRALTPRNEDQRDLRSRALGLAYDAFDTRWLLVLHNSGSISTPLLVALVSWLCVIFLGWGLFAPRNATVLAALFMVALCASVAIFIILELDRPLDGWVRVSDVPMRTALAHLGK